MSTDDFDPVEYGRLLARVEAIAERLDSDRPGWVPRELCGATHSRVAEDIIELRRRLSSLEAALTEAQRLAEAREAERSRDWHARVFGWLGAALAAAAIVTGVVWR